MRKSRRAALIVTGRDGTAMREEEGGCEEGGSRWEEAQNGMIENGAPQTDH